MRPTSFVSQLFPDGNVPLLEASLRFAHHRQTAIANNVANLDTPHYRRQDVDGEAFHDMVRRALRERAEQHPGVWRLRPNLDFAVHEHRRPEVRPDPGAEYPEADGDGPVRHDENNTVPEHELAALQKNTLALMMLQRLFARSVGGTAKAAKFQVE